MFFKIKYKREKDEVYCDLLRLACISDDTYYNEEKLNKLIKTINHLPSYAKFHWRLIPLLSTKAKHLNIFNKLEPNVQSFLKLETKKGIVKEIAKEQQLKEIINLLTNNHIPMILLKGTAFSNILYSKFTPRLSNDIDILIKEEHWELAVNLLKSIMKYKKKRKGVLDELTQISFIPYKGIGASLDLHSRISYPYIFNSWELSLWERSIVHPIFNNRFVRVLESYDAVLHQAIHSFVDMDFFRYNINDTIEIIYNNSIDTYDVLKFSEQYGLDIPVSILINNCKVIIGTKFLSKTQYNSNISRFRMSLAFWISSRCSARKKLNKNLMYRAFQVLSQYVFLQTPFRCLKLQVLFVSSYIKSLY